MKCDDILHIVPGLRENCNGIAVAAKLISESQRRQGNRVGLVEARDFVAWPFVPTEVWVHSMWTPPVWRACRKVLGFRSGKSSPLLVRMTHANLDPVRLAYHGWKKRLVSPIERYLFAQTDRVVVSGSWEMEWCREWGLKNVFETFDLMGCFDFRHSQDPCGLNAAVPLHILYLGRRHPLKGIKYLEQAVAESFASLRIVCDHSGAQLEQDWKWCDVLCLPTLSENFGIVIAEALARGKRVITTDGAPAWAKLSENENWQRRLVFLKGFRNGNDELRVRLLKKAIQLCLDGFCFIQS